MERHSHGSDGNRFGKQGHKLAGDEINFLYRPRQARRFDLGIVGCYIICINMFPNSRDVAVRARDRVPDDARWAVLPRVN